jgi:styrene-oxide isomerase
MERLQRVMLANGLLVVLAAMFAGFMLMFSLLGGVEIWPGNTLQFSVYGTSEGWVRAHSGGTMNGLLVMAIALALPKLNMSGTMQRVTAYGFIYVAWSFTLFYWLGNAAGNRALSVGDNALGESDMLGVIGFLPGLPSVIIVVILLVIAAKAVLAADKDQA